MLSWRVCDRVIGSSKTRIDKGQQSMSKVVVGIQDN